MVEAVQYARLAMQPTRVMVDLSFWLTFTKLKLDVWKLESPQIEIKGYITLPANPSIPQDIIVNEQSFEGHKK